jgi:hypothetical protein
MLLTVSIARHHSSPLVLRPRVTSALVVEVKVTGAVGSAGKVSASNGTFDRSIMSARREAGGDAVDELSEVRREDSRERSEDSGGRDVRREECRLGKGVSEDESLLELVGRELCPRAGCDGDLCQVCVVKPILGAQAAEP